MQIKVRNGRRTPWVSVMGSTEPNKCFKANPVMTSAGNHPRNGCYFRLWRGTVFYACSLEENSDGIQGMNGVRRLCQVLLWEPAICNCWFRLQIQTESIERREDRSVSGVVGERRKLSPGEQTVEKPRGLQAGNLFSPGATWWPKAPNVERRFLKGGQTRSVTEPSRCS